MGAAAGVPDFIAMVVSTGVGGGIVLDGRLLDGAARQRRPHRPRRSSSPTGAACALRRPRAASRPRRRARPSPPSPAGRRPRPAPEVVERDRHARRPGRGLGGEPARPAARGRRRLGGPRLRRAVLRRRPGRDRPPGPARLRRGGTRRSARPASAPTARSSAPPRSAAAGSASRRSAPADLGRTYGHRQPMEPTYTAEAEAYREKIQAFLAEHLPAGWQGIGALPPEEAPAFTERVARRRCTTNGLLAAVVARRSTAAAGSRALEQVDPGRGVRPGRACRRAAATTCSASRWSATRSWSGAPTSRRRTSCRGSSRARTSGARATPSPTPARDLGNLGCRAELDGDEWVINGQKIWTSAGHLANWIFVLARTDPDVAEAQGHHVPARARWTSPASRCARSR